MSDCACRFQCSNKCGLRAVINVARALVIGRLPEGEPDHTCAWVYRVAIETARAGYGSSGTEYPDGIE